MRSVTTNSRFVQALFLFTLIALMGVFMAPSAVFAQIDADDDDDDDDNDDNDDNDNDTTPDDDDDDDDDNIPEEKKTLFVIGHLNAAFLYPLVVYIIDGDQLVQAETWSTPVRDGGAVGLAVDDINEHLFVSYEFSDTVDIFDARTMTPLGTIRLAGTDDLAGMVVDHNRGRLYVVDREMPTLFEFDTTSFELIEQWSLSGCAGAWGLDLAGDRLYATCGTVANPYFTVEYYDVYTQQHLGSINISDAVSIAATNYPEDVIYTQGFGFSDYLAQHYVDSAIQDRVYLGDGGKGVSLDAARGLMYSVSGFGLGGRLGSSVRVYEMGTMTELNRYNLNMFWSPTDCVASTIDFGGFVSKTCTSHPDGIFYTGDEVVFEITITNKHIKPIHYLPMRDVYDTTQLRFLYGDPVSDDNVDDGEIDWSNLISDLTHDLAIGDEYTFEVHFKAVPEDCVTTVDGQNLAQMHDAKDNTNQPLIDAAGAFSYTIDCHCQEDSDCDDSTWCNGLETCGAEGTCVAGTAPCPIDDGIFCNGDETAECDEENQECGHTGDPCPDDGTYCNGGESCDEGSSSCVSAGDPCVSDALYCNGDETCDEQSDDCVHSGNPCPAGTECIEQTDSCDSPEEEEETPDEDGGNEDLWPEGTVTGGCCGCG